MTENAPPGWYQSDADPPGTERYWDGTQWSAETRAVMASPPAVTGDGRDPAQGARFTPHGRELATPGARFGARLIDLIVLGLILVPLVLRDFDLQAASVGNDPLSTGQQLAGGLVSAFYEIGLVGLRSATLGKMAVGIEVVRKVDGQAPVGFPTATMRWLPFAIGYVPILLVANVSFLLLIASLVLVFVDEFRRSVYDFAGQTYVVRKRPRT